MVRWQWPQEGMVKLNVDGNSRGNPGYAGFGGLLRNDNGQWIFGFHGSVGISDNLLPELMVICMCLRLVWARGFRRVLCETDSTEAVRLVYASEVFHWYSAVVIEIKDWLSKDWEVSIKHVLREANAYVGRFLG